MKNKRNKELTQKLKKLEAELEKNKDLYECGKKNKAEKAKLKAEIEELEESKIYFQFQFELYKKENNKLKKIINNVMYQFAQIESKI